MASPTQERINIPQITVSQQLKLGSKSADETDTPEVSITNYSSSPPSSPLALNRPTSPPLPLKKSHPDPTVKFLPEGFGDYLSVPQERLQEEMAHSPSPIVAQLDSDFSTGQNLTANFPTQEFGDCLGVSQGRLLEKMPLSPSQFTTQPDSLNPPKDDQDPTANFPTQDFGTAKGVSQTRLARKMQERFGKNLAGQWNFKIFLRTDKYTAKVPQFLTEEEIEDFFRDERMVGKEKRERTGLNGLPIRDRRRQL